MSARFWGTWIAASVVVTATLLGGARWLRDFGASEEVLRAKEAAAVFPVLALALAWTAGRLVGRRNPQRAQRAPALVLLGLALLFLAVFTVRGFGTLALSPRDLEGVSHWIPAPRSTWIYVAGTTSRRPDPASFLYDVASGDWTRLSRGWPIFSSDGRVALWRSSYLTRSPLRFRRLDPGAPTVHLDVPVPPTARLALSSNGTRVGVVFEGEVAVYDISSSEIVLKAPLPPVGGRKLDPQVARILHYTYWFTLDAPVFSDPDHLRILRYGACPSGAPEILEADVPAGRVTVTGSFCSRRCRGYVRFVESGRYLYLRSLDVTELLDGRTAEPAERGTGQLVIPVGAESADVFDLATGDVRRVPERVVPGAGAEPGSPGARLSLDERHALVSTDPASGKRTVLLGGRK